MIIGITVSLGVVAVGIAIVACCLVQMVADDREGGSNG
jgi:hypothetical protein